MQIGKSPIFTQIYFRQLTQGYGMLFPCLPIYMKRWTIGLFKKYSPLNPC